ncbi:MAG TPA: RibD family protein [Patescibacteria group bacterium]|nr:RibD family protein [Patescibacteria group bacterium]
MKIILSAALSVDGHIAGAGGKRLLLSHAQDLEEVYDMRDTCDAILVGAETIRRDNPSLSTKTEARRKQRLTRGLKAEPIKATLTRSGLLTPDSKFFAEGDGPKIVYCPKDAETALKEKLGKVAEVVGLTNGEPLVAQLATDLERHGVKTLMVEGGAEILTQFLSAGLADELRLALAPLFVGKEDAPRFVKPASFPHSPDRRMILRGVRHVGDMAVMHYELERKK